MPTRKRIPAAVEADIQFKADRKCCVCKAEGDHIHHLDSNPANNVPDNLIFLCFKHHNEATIKVSLRKGLSKETLIRFREQHYREVAAQRASSIKALTTNVSTLTSEDLLQAALDATIILELESVKSCYGDADWEEKEAQIRKLSRYVLHTSNRTAYEILTFLMGAACEARAGMPEDLAGAIMWKAMDFFPTSYRKGNKRHDVETGKLCLAIGYSIAYDSPIKLGKLVLMPYGLTVWKHVYEHAKRTKNVRLLQEVIRHYDKLEETLQRPERNDLNNALEFVRVFRADLDEATFGFPPYPRHLIEIIEMEQKL